MSEAGHNSALTNDERKALFFHHYRKIAEKKAAVDALREEYKTLRKQAKADGLVLADMDFALRCAEVDDAGIIPDEIRRQAEIASWFALTPGFQADLFTDRAPALERIEAEGKAAGMAAKDCDGHGYAKGSEEAHAYERGWQSGQKDMLDNLASALAKKSAEADEDGTTLVKRGDAQIDGDEGGEGEDPFEDDDEPDLRPPFLQNAHADPVA